MKPKEVKEYLDRFVIEQVGVPTAAKFVPVHGARLPAAECRMMPRRCCASAARSFSVLVLIARRLDSWQPPAPWLYAIITTGRGDASMIPAFGVRTIPSRRLGSKDAEPVLLFACPISLSTVARNILISGPTGSGKTYLVRTMAKMLGVPFAKDLQLQQLP